MSKIKLGKTDMVLGTIAVFSIVAIFWWVQQPDYKTTHPDWQESCFDLGNSTQFIPYLDCFSSRICTNNSYSVGFRNNTLIYRYDHSVVSNISVVGNGNITKIGCVRDQ